MKASVYYPESGHTYTQESDSKITLESYSVSMELGLCRASQVNLDVRHGGPNAAALPLVSLTLTREEAVEFVTALSRELLK